MLDFVPPLPPRVRALATAVGGFATDAFEIRDGMRTAARDNEPEPSDD